MKAVLNEQISAIGYMVEAEEWTKNHHQGGGFMISQPRPECVQIEEGFLITKDYEDIYEEAGFQRPHFFCCSLNFLGMLPRKHFPDKILTPAIKRGLYTFPEDLEMYPSLYWYTKDSIDYYFI
jgi:hypothetical protein